ncbi:branched-chain amino acid ABC transporter substrate-binding protein [Archaeoglobales archaeon]|nr:MAG: branched-chain amino acid ABC transporter substrate-binding protein [Archaeoglobales archaeon]
MAWKKAVIILLLVALVLGCAQQPQKPKVTPTPTAAPVEKIVIGAPLSLSGKYAKEGQQSLWGIQAAVKWVNDVHGGIDVGGKKVKIEFKYYDDESKKETVQSLVERLITVDKVNFLLAPYSSGLTLAGAPIADKHKVLYMSHGGASDRIFEQGYKYVVQTLSPASKYQTGFLDMIKETDPEAKKVAFVYEDAEFSKAVFAGAKSHAEELGFEIVFDKTYPPKPTDLTPILSELKAANPDIVLGGGHFADGQLLASQMADLKVDVKAISIIVAPALPAFYEALGTNAEGICGPGQWEIGVKYSPEAAEKLGIDWYGPTQDEFLQLFKEFAGDEEPSYHAAEAAAAILAYAKAIETAQSTDSDSVRDTMSTLDYMTFFGRWKIDPETGKQIGHDMIVFQWQGGEKVIVWPPEAANAQPYYPIPTWDEKEAGKLAKYE